MSKDKSIDDDLTGSERETFMGAKRVRPDSVAAGCYPEIDEAVVPKLKIEDTCPDLDSEEG